MFLTRKRKRIFLGGRRDKEGPMAVWNKIKSVFKRGETKAKVEQQKSSREPEQGKKTEAADKSQTNSSSSTRTPL